MNARQVHTTVTLMPDVTTPKDHSTARVIRDTLEMESRVLVSGSCKQIIFIGLSRCYLTLYEWDKLLSYISFKDITECDDKNLAPHHSHYAHICHDDANCTNTKGSFYCTCHTGYSGDGVICSGNRSYLKGKEC